MFIFVLISGLFLVILFADMGDKRYLFQFFNNVNKDRVLFGAPWFFNNHLLILNKICPRENPMSVSLSYFDYWVQVHDLPTGLMSSHMANQFGDFLGIFIEYDTTVPMIGVKTYMRIKIKLDVGSPLKRRKKSLWALIVSFALGFSMRN